MAMVNIVLTVFSLFMRFTRVTILRSLWTNETRYGGVVLSVVDSNLEMAGFCYVYAVLSPSADIPVPFQLLISHLQAPRLRGKRLKKLSGRTSHLLQTQHHHHNNTYISQNGGR